MSPVESLICISTHVWRCLKNILRYHRATHASAWLQLDYLSLSQNDSLYRAETVQSSFMFSSHCVTCSHMYQIPPGPPPWNASWLKFLSVSESTPGLDPCHPAIHSFSWGGLIAPKLNSNPQLRFGIWPCLVNSTIIFIISELFIHRNGSGKLYDRKEGLQALFWDFMCIAF